METIKSYFNAERNESVFFVVFGIIALIIALVFLCYSKSSFQKGIAAPLLLVSLIQISVGATVWMRSPKDISRMEHYLQNDSEKITTDEIPRMILVMKNFEIYRYIEIGLLSLAILLIYFGKQHQFLNGIGLGLFIQSSLMLGLDFFAEKRAAVYLQQLHELMKK